MECLALVMQAKNRMLLELKLEGAESKPTQISLDVRKLGTVED